MKATASLCGSLYDKITAWFKILISKPLIAFLRYPIVPAGYVCCTSIFPCCLEWLLSKAKVCEYKDINQKGQVICNE